VLDLLCHGVGRRRNLVRQIHSKLGLLVGSLGNSVTGPGMRHAVVGQTKRGDVLQLLERESGWLHVRTGELDAWLYATLAEDVKLPEVRGVREPRITPSAPD
jgi:hypothetical protein